MSRLGWLVRSLKAGSTAKVLLEEHQPGYLVVAESPVGPLADRVPYVGVGRHLGASLRSCPGFCRLDQCPTDLLASRVWIDIPALDRKSVV